MRWVYTGLVAVFLAGCDSPSPRFAGVEPVEATVDGSVFSIRLKGGEAEAIRLSFEPGVRRGPTLVRAVEAIEQASGCDVVGYTVEGDTNVVRATLNCAG